MERAGYLPLNYQAIREFVRSCCGERADWFEHFEAVAIMARTPEDWVVGMMHDLLEDGLASAPEIGSLLRVQAPELDISAILAALALLNHDKSEPYPVYIERIATSTNEPAINVKLFDLFDHLSPYRRATMPRKNLEIYCSAIQRLADVRMD